MKLLRTAVALATASLLLVGCEANKPSSASDNATPPYTATAADAANAAALAALNVSIDAAATANSESGFPIFEVPSGKTVALWAPFKGDANSIPFPVDLLFNGTTDGTLNIPLSGSAAAFYQGYSYPQEKTPPAAVLADPMVALNTQDGFSTTANMAIRFSAAIDATTLPSGIRIFEMNGNTHAGFTLTGAASDVKRELAYGVDFVLAPDQTSTTVVIQPIKPLESSTTYRVVVTTALKDTSGSSVVAYGAYQAQRLGVLALFPQVPLYEKALAAYTAASPFPLVAGAQTPANPAGNIALSYSITTQNLTAALQQAQGVVATAAAPTIAVGPLPAPVNTQVTTGFQAANTQVYVGAISGMTSFLNPADPVHSIWSSGGNNLSPLNAFTPDANVTKVTVPVLVNAPDAAATIDPDGPGPATAVPCSAAFPSGYPVVIFQHGITSNRGTLLALAGALTKVCAVGIAIDLPEHGIIPASFADIQADTGAGKDNPFGFLAMSPNMTNPLAGGVSPTGPTGERLVANGAGTNGAAHCLSGPSVDVTGGGDYRCAAGDSYINLTNLANSRDVLRQSVIDLDSLYLALKGAGVVTVDGTGAPTGTLPIDKTKISFVGMSLGSIVGETFVATLGNIGGSLTSAVFNVGGGGIAKLLDGSPTFEPIITAGLAAQGVTKPSSTYEIFLIAAQTLVDSADPINYATTLNTLKATMPILFQEVVGNGSSSSPDQVVPNNVFGAATGSLGGAWSAVSGSLVQAAVWASQNPMTNPSVLGGADSLAQGTAFLPVATIANTTGHPLQAAAGACVAAHDTQCVLPGVMPFYGIGLPQVAPTGGAGSGLVRFAGGTHSSLLDPASNQLVTVMMQTQVAGFIGSAVAGSAAIAGESACTPVLTVPCAGTIANW